MRVLYAYHPLLDPENPPRQVAELEDVARRALDGEIFIDGPEEGALRLEHDSVVRGVGNGAA